MQDAVRREGGTIYFVLRTHRGSKSTVTRSSEPTICEAMSHRDCALKPSSTNTWYCLAHGTARRKEVPSDNAARGSTFSRQGLLFGTGWGISTPPIRTSYGFMTSPSSHGELRTARVSMLRTLYAENRLGKPRYRGPWLLLQPT